MADLLVEIGTEELPARRVRDAAEALRDGLAAALVEAGLLEGWKPEGRPILGTPRRLAAFVPGVKERQADREERAWGPPASAAIGSDGKPTKAGEGFAKTVGVAFADLKHGEKVAGKPPYVYADRVVKGRAAAEVIAAALPKVVASLPFKRTMRWPQSDMTFARPIRNLVVLLGGAVVPCRVAGVEAGRTTRGHAFLEPKPFEIPKADLAEYVALLRKAKVLVDFAERAAEIEKQVGRARAVANGSAQEVDPGTLDDALLLEVTGLVEWPQSLLGSFDERYLELPPELLIECVRHHLRYFVVWNEKTGRLLPQFVSVTDRDVVHAESIRGGNERVLRARLYDAEFFFANDRKRKLEEFRPGLAGVDFHKGLGTLLDKSERVRRTVLFLSETLKLPTEARAHADRAAFLLKCDLLTEVVKEFPELQGAIGSTYAAQGGEKIPVSSALLHQYCPAGEQLEQAVKSDLSGDVNAVVYVADKLDTLAAYFSIGEVPTGSADPYGLRRAALGLLDVLETKRWSLSPGFLVGYALAALPKNPRSIAELPSFVWGRAEQIARARGYTAFIEAVGTTTDRPVCEYFDRLESLRTLASRNSWPDLVALVERTGNMGEAARGELDSDDLPSEARAVAEALAKAKKQAKKIPDPLAFAEMYLDVLGKLVATMFEKVLVDDPKEPARRAAIKGMLHEVYSLFADRLGDLRKLGSGARPPRE